MTEDDLANARLTRKVAAARMAEQDRIIAETMGQRKPNLIDKANALIWPDCSTCAGWRGVVIGLVVAAFVWLVIL